MKPKIFLLFLIFMSMTGYAQEVKVSTGKVIHLTNVMSAYVDQRNVDIWLPEGYDGKEKYAVLYMHDGQMIYGHETTWNNQSWEVHQTASQLMADNKTQKFIVVGIANNGLKRHQEYFPRKPFEMLTEAQKDFVSDVLLQKGRIEQPLQPVSDNYLKFIVTELKPYIDQSYAVKTDRSHTFIAGSSMGGLISLYAICEYPEVFGGAACLSTHWTGIYQLDNNPVPDTFFRYLKEKLPNPKTHKIYFDYGDKTLDALYPTLQQKVDTIMKVKGFTAKNWMTRFFPGNDHSEVSWRDRFHIPLAFLLKL
jgi:enterochelin esterase-like enzyme